MPHRQRKKYPEKAPDYLNWEEVGLNMREVLDRLAADARRSFATAGMPRMYDAMVAPSLTFGDSTVTITSTHTGDTTGYYYAVMHPTVYRDLTGGTWLDMD